MIEILRILVSVYYTMVKVSATAQSYQENRDSLNYRGLEFGRQLKSNVRILMAPVTMRKVKNL